MTEYEYIIYSENGTVTTNQRNIPFSISELQNIFGGSVEILPVKIPGIKGFTNVYVVSDDGIYKYKPNSVFPQFYGNVLYVNKNKILVR
jgi:hypothetical protein